MKWIKNNFKTVIICVIVSAIISSINVFATYMYMANEIVYASRDFGNMTVETALDDLYGAAKNYANPTGAIIQMMGNSAPVGYLKADGTVYNISEYKKLADYFKEQFGTSNYFGGDGTTTFAVPDLRGEFLRGSGVNSHPNNGNGGNVGAHQDSTYIPHVYYYDSGESVFAVATSNNNGTNVINNYDTVITNTGRFRDTNVGNTGSRSHTVGGTIRPTNTSVLYCIKY